MHNAEYRRNYVIYTGVNMQQETIIKPHNVMYSNKTLS